MEPINFIQGLGQLLANYDSDLTYIRDFQRYKNGVITTNDYLQKSTGTFKLFINEFRVARNVNKNETKTLLKMTLQWIASKNPNDVDGFAEILKKKGITHGKTMTSLASKILFLNNPWQILPQDNQAKQSLKLQGNLYSDYLPLTKDFIKKYKKEIHRYLNSVDQHLTIIESSFKKEIKDIKIIRFNRYVDKILWTSG